MSFQCVVKNTGEVGLALLKLTSASSGNLMQLKGIACSALRIAEITTKLKSDDQQWYNFGSYVQDAVACVMLFISCTEEPIDDPQVITGIVNLRCVLNRIFLGVRTVQDQGGFTKDPNVVDMRKELDGALGHFQSNSMTTTTGPEADDILYAVKTKLFGRSFESIFPVDILLIQVVNNLLPNFEESLSVFNSTVNPTKDPAKWLKANRDAIDAVFTTIKDVVGPWFRGGDIISPLSHNLHYDAPFQRLLVCTAVHCALDVGEWEMNKQRSSSLRQSPISSLESALKRWSKVDYISALLSYRSISDFLFDLLKHCKERGIKFPGFITVDQLDQLLAIDITALCTQLLVVVQDASMYDSLLNQQDDKAQGLLDLLQALLDYHGLDPRMKPPLVRTISRLSKKSGTHAIGGGSFGDIYKGHVYGDSVAVKVMRVFGRPDDLSRLNKLFVQEAVIWRQMLHPNILPFLGIHRLETDVPRVCLISPWLENGNVVEFLEAFPDTDRLKLVLDVALGLEYLHCFTPKIVHGDIKGGNVLVTSTLRACLADFGLTAIRDSDGAGRALSASSRPAGGTLRWQAPELLGGESDNVPSTPATDVYAFACTCYEMLTGEKPFHEFANDARIIMAVLNGRRPSRPSANMSKLVLDDPMWNIIESCWKQESGARLTSTEIVQKLQVHVKTPAYDEKYLRRSFLRSCLGEDHAFGMPTASRLLPAFPVLRGVKISGLDLGTARAEVWKAESHDRYLAIRVPRVYLKTNMVRAIKTLTREYKLWINLHHPNILPLYGIYFLDDTWKKICLVFPWMGHGHIRDYLRAFPDTNRHVLVSDIANGLQYLHNTDPSIIHGNLRAESVLITSTLRACLSGFQMSLVANSNLHSCSPTATLSGSSEHGSSVYVRWQAPELFRNDMEDLGRNTTASDIYALACLYYEIYSGRVPFYDILGDGQVLIAVLEGKRPSRPNGPGDETWALIESCWGQEASCRPTANEIVCRLQEISPSVPWVPLDEWDTDSVARIRSFLAKGL